MTEFHAATSDEILDAVANAEQLWPHNANAIEDPGIELAVLAALAKPTRDTPNGRALWRRAGKHQSPIRSLFAAVFDKAARWTDFDFFAAPCDRCVRDLQPTASLWVAAGATVVDVHVCSACRRELDQSLHGLVWS